MMKNELDPNVRPHTTHFACDERMAKYGSKTVGCCCTGHVCQVTNNSPVDSPTDDSAAVLKNMLDGILATADAEREKSESYKGLFSEPGLDTMLHRTNNDMVKVVLDASHVLKNKYGHNDVNNKAYYMLLALPFLANKLRKHIEATEGNSCVVDKTYFILGKALEVALDDTND